MDKYTLRFRNTILETKYRKGQYDLLTPYFYLSQAIFAVAILFFLVYGAFIVFSLRSVAHCSFQIILILVGTKVGSNHPQYRQIIALVENLILSLNQLFFVSSIQSLTGGASQLYKIPHQSYMSGYFVGGINASTIVGPDFLHNFIGLSLLVLVKLIIGVTWDFSTISLEIPIVGILMIHTCYYKELNNRLSFLGQQKQTGLELLLYQGFQESLIQCSVNEQDCQIEHKLSNKRFQQEYNVYDDYTMRLFFRRVKVVEKKRGKNDLEQWIWFHANSVQNLDQLSEGTIQCEFLQDGTLETYTVKIICQYIDKKVYSLFFIPAERTNCDQLNQDDKDATTLKYTPSQPQTQNIIIPLLRLCKVIIKRYGHCDRLLKNKLQLYCLNICNLVLLQNLKPNNTLAMYNISSQEFLSILKQVQKVFMNTQAKYEFQGQQIQFGTSLQLSINLHLLILSWFRQNKIKLIKVKIDANNNLNKPLIEIMYLIDTSIKKDQFSILKQKTKTVIQYIGIIDSFRQNQYGRVISLCLIDFLNLYK